MLKGFSTKAEIAEKIWNNSAACWPSRWRAKKKWADFLTFCSWFEKIYDNKTLTPLEEQFLCDCRD
jgi:hypothetical protein